jgi:hypothetical protein
MGILVIWRGHRRSGFGRGHRRQATLLSKCLDEWIDESNQFAQSICSSMSWTGRAQADQRCPPCSCIRTEQRNEFEIAEAAQHGRPIAGAPIIKVRDASPDRLRLLGNLLRGRIDATP